MPVEVNAFDGLGELVVGLTIILGANATFTAVDTSSWRSPNGAVEMVAIGSWALDCRGNERAYFAIVARRPATIVAHGVWTTARRRCRPRSR